MIAFMHKFGSPAFYRMIDPVVLAAGFHRAPSGWLSPEQNQILHDFDLWHIASGKGAVKVDGRWHAFQAGDLVTLVPGRNYQRERADQHDPFQVYYVHMMPFASSRRRELRALADAWPIVMPMANKDGMTLLFNELFEAFTTKPEGYGLIEKAASLRILREVLVNRFAPIPSDMPPHDKLQRARNYIERCHAQRPTLDDISENSELSASYLVALFKRFFGCSPVDYRITCQLRSAQLLLARGASASRAAEAAGFASLHYFSRLFKRRLGISPSRYAVQRRQERYALPRQP
jgi:AraC-like DNA-binding protein